MEAKIKIAVLCFDVSDIDIITVNNRLMETLKQNIDLPEKEKLRRLKEAKGGTWYDGWRPYCMMCNRSDRMVSEPYGFKCPQCGNMIGFNLKRLKESPLKIVWKETGDDKRVTIKLSLSINDDDNDNVFYYCNGIESFQQLAEYGMREFIVTYCWSFF